MWKKSAEKFAAFPAEISFPEESWEKGTVWIKNIKTRICKESHLIYRKKHHSALSISSGQPDIFGFDSGHLKDMFNSWLSQGPLNYITSPTLFKAEAIKSFLDY